MLNRIILMGRMAKDAELRRTQSGVAVTSFRIACDRDFKSQSGEKETDWIDVVAWRNTAEFVNKYFGKGRMIVVEGRLQTREWTDKDGNKRVAVEVVADSVYFGDSKNGKNESSDDNYGDTATQGTPYSVPAAGSDHFAEIDDEDGDLPF